jgi:uncharacterized protein (DUF1697 family)
MPTSIALLRGINVGGNKKVPMAELRTLLTEAGFTNVRTYIQSGNVVLDHPRRSDEKLQDEIEVHIAGHFGFDVPVIVRHATQLAAVIDANPFPDADTSKLHVGFLRGDAAAGAEDVLAAKAAGAEEFALVGRELYLHLPDGLGRSKLAASLDRLGTPVTARNWRTTQTLLEMAST